MSSLHEIIGSTGTIVGICATLIAGVIAIGRWVITRKRKSVENINALINPIQGYLVSARATLSDMNTVNYNIEFRLTNPTKNTLPIIECLIVFNPGFLGEKNTARARLLVKESQPNLPIMIQPSEALNIKLHPTLKVTEIGRAHIDRFDCIFTDHLQRKYSQRVTGLKLNG